MRAEDLIAEHVLPVALCQIVDGGYKPLAICGTGFTFGEGTFITCWHCVSEPLASDQVYGAAVREGGVYSSAYTHILPIDLLEKDSNGVDLALGRIDAQPELRLHLASAPFGWGQEVMAIGYPLPRVAGKRFSTGARLLKGYVTRLMEDDRPGQPATRAYELDLAAPGGISGAPLLDVVTFAIGGVVYGDWDDREPGEDSRAFTFGMAHHLEPLTNASGPATDRMPLGEYLRTKIDPQRHD